MEKDILETFEAAKRAADAAADGGGPSEVDRCVDALRRLEKIPVTTKVLVDTQVGKRLRPLAKHSQEKIQAVASDILKLWKNVVINEISNNKQKANTTQEKKALQTEAKSEQAENIKVERMARYATANGDLVAVSKSIEVEMVRSSQGAKVQKASKLETVNKEKGGNVEKIIRETPTVEWVPKDEKQATNKNLPSALSVPPKLTAMVKCNNAVRDKLREVLAETLSRVSKETLESTRDEVRNIWDEVDACDPLRVAVTVESALFEKLGPSSGSHKAKIRSILFNLKDSNNPDFRRQVLLGHVKPEEMADMAPEDMASDERKRSNKQIKEKALFECERGIAPKATTDQFKCGRCGQRKTTYYQMQTRSADEPMTTYVTCVNCNKHWKFC